MKKLLCIIIFLLNISINYYKGSFQIEFKVQQVSAQETDMGDPSWLDSLPDDSGNYLETTNAGYAKLPNILLAEVVVTATAPNWMYPKPVYYPYFQYDANTHSVFGYNPNTNTWVGLGNPASPQTPITNHNPSSILTPCQEKAVVSSTISQPSNMMSYYSLLNHYNSPYEWGEDITATFIGDPTRQYGLISYDSPHTNSLTNYFSPTFPLPSSGCNCMGIGYIHTHPAGYPPSALDVLTLAQAQNTALYQATTVQQQNFINANFMGITTIGSSIWIVTITNPLGAILQIAPYASSDQVLEGRLAYLCNVEGYTQEAALYQMFGANNINIYKSTNGTPGQSQLLTPTGLNTTINPCK